MYSKLEEKINQVLSSYKKIVLCNWDRGVGKTEGGCKMADILANKGKNVLVVSKTDISTKHLMDSFSNMTHSGEIDTKNINTIKSSNIANNIRYNNGSKIDLINYNNKEIDKITSRYDYVIFDDCISIEDLSFLKEVISPIVKEKIVITKSLKELDIDVINYDKEEINEANNINKEQFKQEQLKRLMKELNNIPNIKSTTMTRESIMNMIKIVNEL